MDDQIKSEEPQAKLEEGESRQGVVIGILVMVLIGLLAYFVSRSI